MYIHAYVYLHLLCLWISIVCVSWGKQIDTECDSMQDGGDLCVLNSIIDPTGNQNDVLSYELFHPT